MTYPFHAPPPAQEKSRSRTWLWITLAAVGGMLVGIAIGTAGSGTQAVNQASAPRTVTIKVPAPAPPAVTVTVTVPVPAPPPQPAAAPVGPLTTFGNGTYEVGTDVAPGRYRSPGVQDSIAPLCYWDLTDADGTIVDQGVAPEGPSRATLREGLTFTSQGCQDWLQS